MTLVLSSKAVIEKKLAQLTERCSKLKQKGITPNLQVILVGNHPPSLIYTKKKKQLCEKVGAHCDIVHFAEDIAEQELLNKLDAINNDPNVHGSFIQLPLPKHLQHIDTSTLVKAEKDIDGFHPVNVTKLLSNSKEDYLRPCTPSGVMTLLEENNIDLTGKYVVVIGRSMIVGKPMAHLALNANATVTICHSRTNNIESFTRKADVIITAVGKTRFLNEKYIGDNKPVIIDVGINHDENKILCGDVDYEKVAELTSAITPVPGGVGPLTVFKVVDNLLSATEYQAKG